MEPGALIKGPAVIGNSTEVRQGAYMRGNCLVGNNCVVGHATEIKNSILLDGAKAGHFAYVGDSILGNAANLGAGTKLANLKMVPGSIVIRFDGKQYDTQRRKLGAILGDHTETGCNSVTSPGTLMGPSSIVFSGVTVAVGYHPDRTRVAPPKDCPRIKLLIWNIASWPLFQSLGAVNHNRLSRDVTIHAARFGFDRADSVNHPHSADDLAEYRISPTLGCFAFEI